MAERHTFRELEEWQQDQLRNTKHMHKIYILAHIQKYMRPFWMRMVLFVDSLPAFWIDGCYFKCEWKHGS